MTLSFSRFPHLPPPAEIPETGVSLPPATADTAEPVDTTLQTLRTRLEGQIAGESEQMTPEERAHQDRIRHRLAQVQLAQERLRDGTYGTCLDCTQPIEGERLFALPFAIRCVRCQTIAEWRGYSY